MPKKSSCARSHRSIIFSCEFDSLKNEPCDEIDVDQSATLHRVTERIDDGNVLRTLPYRLGPDKSYTWNQALAYETGIRLAIDVLTHGRDAVN